jgi:parallel beta-helix repeat protein
MILSSPQSWLNELIVVRRKTSVLLTWLVEPMIKFLSMVIFFAYFAIAFSPYSANTEDCSGMIAYMINTNGQCVNLDHLQSQIPLDRDSSTQSSSESISGTGRIRSFSSRKNINATVGDANNQASGFSAQQNLNSSVTTNGTAAVDSGARPVPVNSDNNVAAVNVPAANGAAVNNDVAVDSMAPQIKASDRLVTGNINDRSKDHEFPPQKTLNTIVVDNNRALLAAIRQLKAGDRLLVKSGIYQSSRGDEITVTAQGTADNWAVIAAYPGERPQLKNTVRLKGAAYVEMYGFEVIGPNPIQDPSGSGIAITNRAHDIRLIENTIHDVPGGGIEVKHADYLYIEGNRIYNSAWGWIPEDSDSSYAHSAISFYQLMNAEQSKPEIRNIVRSNSISNVYNTRPFVAGDTITDGNCFILDDTKYTGDRDESVLDGYSRPYAGTTLVENNLCVDNGGRGIHAFVSNNLIARNNTLYKNGKTPGIDGELSASSSSNIRFYNNILYANSTSRAVINYKSSDVLIENNLLFGSSIIDRGIGTLIKADPLFVNANTDLSTADFSLRQGSPAIGVGSDKNCSEAYFDGTPRSGPCNLGAFPAAR